MADRTEKQIIGALGEDIASKYLKNKGFMVLERNYLKKCGEIDIIAQKAGILHFIEVKSVTCEIFGFGERGVAHETSAFRPEDNIHPEKLRRLGRTIQVYLFDRHKTEEPLWVFDAITVKINSTTKKAIIKFIEDIVI